MRQPCRAHALQRLADALAFIDADAADLVHALRGEEIGDVIPHAAIDVVAIGRLQVAHQALVIHHCDALFELLQRGLACGCLAHGRRNRDAGLIGSEVIGKDRKIPALVVGPAGLVRTFVLRVVAVHGDLPLAVLAHVFVLEHAAAHAGIALGIAEEGKAIPAALADSPSTERLTTG